MKNLLEKLRIGIVTLLSIVVLGMFVPVVISSFVAMFSRITFEDCITSVLFWVITIISLGIAGLYINDNEE